MGIKVGRRRKGEIKRIELNTIGMQIIHWERGINLGRSKKGTFCSEVFAVVV